jgi:hypothetical protein
MARVRSIWPEFFLTAELAARSPLHRVLYAGLATVCDREGRGDDRPADLKIRLLPLDAVDAAGVDDMLADLAASGFIERYQVAGRRYFAIRDDWKKQHPHVKEPASGRPPPPSGTGGARDEHRTGTVLTPVPAPANDETSTSPAPGEHTDLLSLISDHDHDHQKLLPGGKPKRTRKRKIESESSGEHQHLVDHGVQVIESATGVKYVFDSEDGKHTKDLLRKFGLQSAKVVFDLAARRYQTDEFHRGRGLTFRLVKNDANALRTANKAAIHGSSNRAPTGPCPKCHIPAKYQTAHHAKVCSERDLSAEEAASAHANEPSGPPTGEGTAA